MTTTVSRGLVVAVLQQQAEFFPGRGISLDSLWRAAGCPPGKSPRVWVSGPAAPLVGEFATYRTRLERRTPVRGGCPILWVWDEKDGDPWRNGDVMADELLARIYADFLEDRRGR